jgi:2-keto-4-pentenoate hydratase/2-oxohepta-3-ene-1,7-dioic acid hydratase in catechol pathway
MSFSLLVFLRWQAEFAAGAGVLRLAGGPEGVHGELELAALVGTTFRLIPCGELQI